MIARDIASQAVAGAPLLKVSGLTIGFPLHDGHALAANAVAAGGTVGTGMNQLGVMAGIQQKF